MPKGYYSVPEEKSEGCDGCYIYENSESCTEESCTGIIWKKENKVDRELEIFMLEYLTENIEEIEREYYRARIDSILPDIKKVIKGHPLRDEIVEAIKDCIVSNGNTPNNIFVESIKRMSDKLGYR